MTAPSTTKVAIARLKARLKAVQREQDRLDGLDIDAGDAVTQTMKADLTARFAYQKEVLRKELNLRHDADKLNDALSAVQDHEALKARLRAAYGEDFRVGDLSSEDRGAYGRSLSARAGALEVVSLNPNTAPADLLKDLVTRRLQVRTQIDDFKKEHPAFYRDGADVGSPCMSCNQAGVDAATQNAVNYRRAMQSKEAFSGRQSRKDSCALMSAQSVLLERDGKAPDETALFSKDMVDIGTDSGGYQKCSGTTDEAKVLTEAGVPATLTYDPTPEDIARNLEEGRAVVVAYDTRPVWYPDSATWDPQPAGHAVRVTGVERDLQGEISAFYINDSGDGIAGKRVDIATFNQAMQWADENGTVVSRMAVSDQPVFEKFE